MITLSIIVVNWNTRDLLAQCLESVFRCPPACEFQVWVVDNASSDESVQMVGERFPAVQLILNPQNAGFARANNQVLRENNARYALLLNSDALVQAHALTRLIAALEGSPAIGAVGPVYLNPDGSFQASYASSPSLLSSIVQLLGMSRRLWGPHYPSREPQDSRVARSVDWIPGTCLMVKADLIRDVGLMDEGFFFYSEEVDWCYRMRQRGWEVWFIPEAVVIHKLGQSARKIVDISLWHLYRGQLRFFAKHRGLAQTAVLKLCMVSSLYARSLVLRIAHALHDANRRDWRVYAQLASRISHEPLHIAYNKMSRIPC